MQYMINDAGAHGIPRIRYADGTDALNIDDPEAESVFMAMAMAWACKELAALSRFLGDNAYAQQLLEQRAALVETINRKAWDGEWYLRAFSKFGPVGSKSSPTGGNHLYQPAGLVDPGRRRTGRPAGRSSDCNRQNGQKIRHPAL